MLAGCGGGGDDDFFNDPIPFRGSWVGSIFADGQQGETMRLTIANDGSITGSENVGQDTAALTGNVDRDGRFDILSRLAGTQDVRYTGDMDFDVNGRLVGQGTGTQGNQQVNIEFILNEQGF
jgi:hypothetical protein